MHTCQLRVTGGTTSFPGSRSWWENQCGGFRGETPELDSDLRVGDESSSLFKLAGEADYRRVLALAARASQATPGWTWTVSLDLAGSGESWLGPVDIAFEDGATYDVSAGVLRRYLGRHAPPWEPLPAIQAPPAAPSIVSHAQPGQLWMTLQGKAAKKAKQATFDLVFDIAWDTSPPRPGDPPNTWMMNRYTRDDAQRFVELAGTLHAQFGVTVELDAVQGPFAGIALPPGVSVLGGTAPGGLAPTLVPELVERELRGQRAWWVDGALVAVLDGDDLIIEGLRQATGVDSRGPATLPLPAGRFDPNDPHLVPSLHKRVAAQRERAELCTQLPAVQRRPAAAVLAGDTPTLDDNEAVSVLTGEWPHPLLPVHQVLWKATTIEQRARLGLKHLADAGWASTGIAEALDTHWEQYGAAVAKVFARRGKDTHLGSLLRRHATEPAVWRAAYDRLARKADDSAAAKILAAAVKAAGPREGLQALRDGAPLAAQQILDELLGYEAPAAPIVGPLTPWPRGLVVLPESSLSELYERAVKRLHTLASKASWPVAPQLGPDGLFVPLPTTLSDDEAERARAQALAIAWAASKTKLRSLDAEVTVHDTSGGLAHRVQAKGGSFRDHADYWRERVLQAGVRSPRLPKPDRIRPPSPWPTYGDTDQHAPYDFRDCKPLPALRHPGGPAYALVAEGGDALWVPDWSAFDPSADGPFGPPGVWKPAELSLLRAYQAREDTLAFYQRTEAHFRRVGSYWGREVRDLVVLHLEGHAPQLPDASSEEVLDALVAREEAAADTGFRPFAWVKARLTAD